jgi:hypothetical protein
MTTLGWPGVAPFFFEGWDSTGVSRKVRENGGAAGFFLGLRLIYF